jgi:fructose-1,6-bisphosphatase
MNIPLTLEQFILKNQTTQASGTFTSVMTDVALACRITAAKIRNGNFYLHQHEGQKINSSGDKQLPLDMLANDIFQSIGDNNGNLAAFVSEELSDVHYYSSAKNAKYFLVVDPLDGSGNLDINAPVASIFSICKNPSLSQPTVSEILEAARSPIASGICLYGLATTFCYTTGQGVHGFTQDLESGEFFYTHPNIKIKTVAHEVAINYSNRNFWNKAIIRYIEECFSGEEGPRGRYFNTRWYASAAAELNRILNRGGVFLYPACSNGKPKGVLRKVYEAYPMAHLTEAAGGKASDGHIRILEIPATSLHEKTPFMMGTAEEIDRLEKYHLEMNEAQ